ENQWNRASLRRLLRILESALAPTHSYIRSLFRSFTRIAPLQPDFAPVGEVPARTTAQHVCAQAVIVLEDHRALGLAHLAGGFRNHPIQPVAHSEFFPAELLQFDVALQSAVASLFVERSSDLLDGLHLDDLARFQ